MKKGRSVSSWGKAGVLCLLLFCALGILLLPDQVWAFGVYCSAGAGADGQVVTDTPPGQFEVNGFAAAASTNTYASAIATASGGLATASMRVYAFAYSEGEPNNTFPYTEIGHVAGCGGSVTIEDTLFFDVPAGYYPQGVTVRSDAFFSGFFGHSGDPTGGEYQFVARFGGTQHSASGRGGPPDIFVWENLLLEKKILWDNANLVEGHRFLVDVMAYLYASATAGSGPDSRSVTADFSHSAGFLRVETPPGVTWGSESGVFLTSQVPLPPSLLLLGSGLLGLAGWRRFRKS